MKELQPVNQNVLLELTENKQEQRTASGIIIPDSAKEKENTGKVIAIGNIENAEITVGDKVFYKEFSGISTELNGKKYLILPYSDLIAKIVETDEI